MCCVNRGNQAKSSPRRALTYCSHCISDVWMQLDTVTAVTVDRNRTSKTEMLTNISQSCVWSGRCCMGGFVVVSTSNEILTLLTMSPANSPLRCPLTHPCIDGVYSSSYGCRWVGISHRDKRDGKSFFDR